MDIKKIIRAKHAESFVAGSTVEPKPKLELGTQLKKEIELIEQTTTAKPESPKQLEALETAQRVDSIFESGWEYTQLLKEFRES